MCLPILLEFMLMQMRCSGRVGTLLTGKPVQHCPLTCRKGQEPQTDLVIRFSDTVSTAATCSTGVACGTHCLIAPSTFHMALFVSFVIMWHRECVSECSLSPVTLSFQHKSEPGRSANSVHTGHMCRWSLGTSDWY